jgi:hypothetical protein
VYPGFHPGPGVSTCSTTRFIPNKPKVTSERKLLDLESGFGTYISSRKVYPVSRRFRQGADSRVAAPWPVVAGSFGLHASEGWCYHCPVSHPIPVTNQATQSSRPAGFLFEVPTRFPAHLHISPQRAILRTGASSIANAPNSPKRSNFIELYKKPLPIQSRRDG